MNVAQAILALREHSDKVQDPIAVFLLKDPIAEAVAALRETTQEDRQERSNQEWEDLLAPVSDPVKAANLLLDWQRDKWDAAVKEQQDAEEIGAPDSQRLSRG